MLVGNSRRHGPVDNRLPDSVARRNKYERPARTFAPVNFGRSNIDPLGFLCGLFCKWLPEKRRKLEAESIMEIRMARSVGCAIPENWEPTNDDREYGHRLRLSDLQIDAMAEDMRLWAGANANRQIARKANWSLAFKGWMRRESKRNSGGFNGQGRSRELQNDSRSLTQAADRLIEKSKRGEFLIGERPSLFDLLPGASQDSVRMLPKR